MQATTLPTIFRDAVSEYAGNVPDRPWSSGGYTYATDGRVCVRMPGEHAEPFDFPHVSQLRWHIAGPTFALPSADAIAAKGKVCPCCDGKRHWVREMCGACEGDGCSYCRSGYTPDAPDESRRCPECFGSGATFDLYQFLPIGDRWFAGAYSLALIRDGATHARLGTGVIPPALFVGDGWEALLMPVQVRDGDPIDSLAATPEAR